MTLGVADKQGDLFDDVERFCDEALAGNSIYAVLHRERGRLFPDELFADLFSDRGRRSVPPSVVATVMVLQRLECLSDREAVERFTFDARWRYAAGVGGYDSGNRECFAHTVLVDMRARLAASEDPKRIFNVSVEAASEAGLVGAKRVLDTTPLYDAVATMDTITLIRSALRGLLRAADEGLEAELRAELVSGDDYATSAKPQIDWDDPEAREALIDSRARDAYACLVLLDGRELGPPVAEAAESLLHRAGPAFGLLHRSEHAAEHGARPGREHYGERAPGRDRGTGVEHRRRGRVRRVHAGLSRLRDGGWLARQDRFYDEEAAGLDHARVGRHDVALGGDDQVAGHDLGRKYVLVQAIADDFGAARREVVEGGDLVLGAELVHEAEQP